MSSNNDVTIIHIDNNSEDLSKSEIDFAKKVCYGLIKAYRDFENSFSNYTSLATNYYYSLVLSNSSSFEDTVIKEIHEEAYDVNNGLKIHDSFCNISDSISGSLKELMKRNSKYSTLSNPFWHKSFLEKFANLHPLDIIFSNDYSVFFSEAKMGKSTFFKSITLKLLKNADSVLYNRPRAYDLNNDTFISFIREPSLKKIIIPFYFDLVDLYDQLVDGQLDFNSYLKDILDLSISDKDLFDKFTLVFFIDGYHHALYSYGDKALGKMVNSLLTSIVDYFGDDDNSHVVIACRNEDISSVNKIPALNKAQKKDFHLMSLDDSCRENLVLNLYEDSFGPSEENINKVKAMLKTLKDFNIDDKLMSSTYILSYIFEIYKSTEKEVFNKKNLLENLSIKIADDIYRQIYVEKNDFPFEEFMNIIYELSWAAKYKKNIGKELFLGIITRYIMDYNHERSKRFEKEISLDLIVSIQRALSLNAKFIVYKDSNYTFASSDFINYLSAKYIKNNYKNEALSSLIKEMINDIDNNEETLRFFFSECDFDQLKNLFTDILELGSNNKTLNYNDIYFAVIIYSLNKKVLDENNRSFFMEAATSFFLKRYIPGVALNQHFEPTIKRRKEIGEIIGKCHLDTRFFDKETQDFIEDVKMCRINSGSFMFGLNKHHISDYQQFENNLFDMNREMYIDDYGKPLSKKMVIPYDFEISKYPVMVGQFKKFIEDDGYNPNKDHWNFSEFSKKWILELNKCADKAASGVNGLEEKNNARNSVLLPSFPFRGDTAPQLNLSWIEVVAYTKWLSNKTGKKYRLPYENEWEYVARRCYNENIRLSFSVSKSLFKKDELLDNIKVEIVSFISHDEDFVFTTDDFKLGELKYDSYAEVVKSNDPNIPKQQMELFLRYRNYHHLVITLNRGIPKYITDCELTIKVSLHGVGEVLMRFNGKGLIDINGNNQGIIDSIYLENGDKYHEYNWGNYFNYNKCISNHDYDSPVAVGLFEEEFDNNYPVDINGNIWEWTQSIFDEEKQNIRPDGSNNIKDLSIIDKETRTTVRGGSFLNVKELARNTFRGRDLIGDRIGLERQGFRLVREIDDND